ncbi:hypothetical protein DAPPUDRAFT_244323 [Daphnia pulex]|uniref:Uncharacterized protein n=1 Tax=Daphnia pulex TaxID=6669 RepID=E9GKP0_DAPPU|nr:hypothetical protein DAPPUDRAFT_244323 [Daphnia pulex]|eukprot:EFX80025.1 hypothetical protein DAPPUDRAFT_244323 [Daphnia pulex]
MTVPELVINQEVEEHFKNLWVISPFFPCPLFGHQDLLAVVKSYHRSSTSIYLRKLLKIFLSNLIEIRTPYQTNGSPG